MGKQQVVFIHIPRTAGTTFGTMVGDDFREQGKVVCGHHWWSFYLEDPDLDRYDFMGGHTAYPLVRLLKGTPMFITMIAEPVSRLVSHQQHQKIYKTHPEFVGLTIEECLDNPLFGRWYNNLQTRQLAVDFTDIVTYPDFLEKAQATRDDLEFAKERLSSFAFVGIKEFFGDSIAKYNRIFNRNLVAPDAPHLPREWKNALSDKALARARALSELDLELYEFALELFKEPSMTDVYHTEGVAELITHLFPHGYLGTCVDVGAYTAKWLSNSYLLEEAGWTVYCIEPNPHCAVMLTGRANVYEYAVGKENKDDVDFYIYHGSDTPGKEASYTGLIHILAGGLTTEFIKVSTRTLDWFMENYFTGDKLDFLSIDTEMTDFDVLCSIDLDRWEVGVVCIEDVNQSAQIADYMTQKGYRFVQRLVFNDIYQRNK